MELTGFLEGAHYRGLLSNPTIYTTSPSDFHLFRSLQNSLNGKNFSSLEDCKRYLEQFFAQKNKKFWEDGIMKLPEKWQKVVEQNGEYIVQFLVKVKNVSFIFT